MERALESIYRNERALLGCFASKLTVGSAWDTRTSYHINNYTVLEPICFINHSLSS